MRAKDLTLLGEVDPSKDVEPHFRKHSTINVGRSEPHTRSCRICRNTAPRRVKSVSWTEVWVCFECHSVTVIYEVDGMSGSPLREVVEIFEEA